MNVPVVCLDTNCLIYFLDDATSARGRWLGEHVFRAAVSGALALRVSTLSLAELLVQPHAAGQPDRALGLRRAIEAVPGLALVPVDADVAAAAADLRAARGLRLADAVVLATALAGSGRLLTNDRRLAAGQQGDEVAVLDDVMAGGPWPGPAPSL